MGFSKTQSRGEVSFHFPQRVAYLSCFRLWVSFEEKKREAMSIYIYSCLNEMINLSSEILIVMRIEKEKLIEFGSNNYSKKESWQLIC